MCGIFFYSEKNNEINGSLLTDLIQLSEKRGLDNLGIFFKNKKLEILKSNIFNEKIYKKDKFFNAIKQKNNFVFGQCRLVTDGPRFKSEFNQPIITDKIIGTHNGIILDYLESDYSENINSENDTRKFYDDISNLNFNNNFELQNFINLKKGIINIIFYNRLNNITYFYSNNGSLYFYKDDKRIIASSEKYFLDVISKKYKLNGKIFKIELNKLFYFNSNIFDVEFVNNLNFYINKKKHTFIKSY